MLKRLLAAALALSLLGVAPLVSAPERPKLLDSVRALSAQITTHTMTLTPDGVLIESTESIQNICTVSSINPQRRLWLTAEHCVSDATLPYFIDGDPVSVVMRDVLNDLAILHSSTLSLPALKLASQAPEWEDAVRIAGHPLGFPTPVIVHGIIASPSNHFTDDPDYNRPFMFIQTAIASGNSGSAIVDRDGKIVSVLQIGFNDFAMAGGVVYEVLKGYKSYWN